MTESKNASGKWWKNMYNEKAISFMRISNFWWLLVILGGGIVLLMISSFMSISGNAPLDAVSGGGINKEAVKEEAQKEDALLGAEKELENRLERILGAVEGAGSVEVTVILASGEESVFAQNLNKQNRVIEEKDQSGGNRKTTEFNEQGNLVFAETPNAGKETPVVVKTKRPEVAGVLVLAEGAQDPELREKLVQAVETLLDIPPYKVTVLVKEGG
ncbi:MAG: stage III sporulation protein AG [Thermacetogeniaceae bacterium]